MEGTTAKPRVKVYLATPYSYKTPPGMPRKVDLIAKFMQWLRYRRVTKTTAFWLLKGYNIFSPITHSHPIPKFIPARLDTHALWLGVDFEWIDVCDELWVYMQPGWTDSYGVMKEIHYAKSIGMPVRYLDMNMEFRIPVDEDGNVRYAIA